MVRSSVASWREVPRPHARQQQVAREVEVLRVALKSEGFSGGQRGGALKVARRYLDTEVRIRTGHPMRGSFSSEQWDHESRAFE